MSSLLDTRTKIIMNYAGWTALSALRRSPVKSRAETYPLLDRVRFAELFGRDGTPIRPEAFSNWHREATSEIRSLQPKLCVGWAVKLINMYLKTAAYVGDLGRPGLRELLHPPIDGGLWDGIKRWIGKINLPKSKKRILLGKTHAKRRIKLIEGYDTYETIINGCREVAKIIAAVTKVSCLLVEVDQLWEGGSAKTASDSVSAAPNGSSPG